MSGPGRSWSALTAIVAAAVLAGCGSNAASTQSTSVHLSLTAPVNGAGVNVARVLVFGTVDPPTAKVKVAGGNTRVSNGVFRRWVSLRRGLNHIGIEARAPGYVNATMNVTVRDLPRRYAIPHSPGSPLQDFLNRANQVCSGGVFRLQELALHHLDQAPSAGQAVHIAHQIANITGPIIPRLRAIHAPPQQAAGYAKFVDDLQALLGQANSVVSAAASGNIRGALSAYGGTQATLANVDAEGTALELYTCANGQ